MKYILICILLVLQGCTTVPKAIVQPDKVAIDSYVLESPDPLVLPTKEDLSSPGGILLITKRNTLAYKSCTNRLTAAQVVIRRFSNNP